ncbi:hypothetical protein BH23VER1_BH23VER1_12390 [soil metagenome]
MTTKLPTLALIGTLFVQAIALAERPVEKPDSASHVVTGTVSKVFQRDSTEDSEFLVEIKIQSIEKGAGYAKGDYIFAYAYQRKADAPLVPASSGHSSIPTEGQLIRACIKRGNGQMEALYPDWFEVLLPLTTNEHGNAGSALRKGLDKQLARYKSVPYIEVKEWHYRERKAGELEGTWICEGGSDKAVFGADGSFSESFDGKMTKGLYAISDDGLIVTYSVREGGGWLGGWYRLQSDGKSLTGPKGPIPNAVWRRVAESK